MSQDYEQKIRACEALALRAGTPEEGEVARNRAIELSKKYNIPSIFTQEGYVPPESELKSPRPVREKLLHKNVVILEECLKLFGWKYSHFYNGDRIYYNQRRNNEAIHMAAHMFGEFSCSHFYRPTHSYRPAGKTSPELKDFFNSITYRNELWPHPRHQSDSNFYDPLFNKFEVKVETPNPIVESVKPPEPVPEPIDPEVLAAEQRLDEVDVLLRQKPLSRDVPLVYVLR